MQDILVLQLRSGFLISDLEIASPEGDGLPLSEKALMARIETAFVSNYTAFYLKAGKWIIEARKIKWFRAINRLSWYVYATDKLKRLSPILAAFRGSKTKPYIKE